MISIITSKKCKNQICKGGVICLLYLTVVLPNLGVLNITLLKTILRAVFPRKVDLTHFFENMT